MKPCSKFTSPHGYVHPRRLAETSAIHHRSKQISLHSSSGFHLNMGSPTGRMMASPHLLYVRTFSAISSFPFKTLFRINWCLGVLFAVQFLVLLRSRGTSCLSSDSVRDVSLLADPIQDKAEYSNPPSTFVFCRRSSKQSSLVAVYRATFVFQLLHVLPCHLLRYLLEVAGGLDAFLSVCSPSTCMSYKEESDLPLEFGLSPLPFRSSSCSRFLSTSYLCFCSMVFASYMGPLHFLSLSSLRFVHTFGLTLL